MIDKTAIASTSAHNSRRTLAALSSCVRRIGNERETIGRNSRLPVGDRGADMSGSTLGSLGRGI
jgi:hypothetical protein